MMTAPDFFGNPYAVYRSAPATIRPRESPPLDLQKISNRIIDPPPQPPPLPQTR